MQHRRLGWWIAAMLASGCTKTPGPATPKPDDGPCSRRATERPADLLWLAENCPTYDQSRLLIFGEPPTAELVTAWEAQVDEHPDDARVLGNAAKLFEGLDDERALELHARAEAVDPKNPRWPEAQARIHHRNARFRTTDDTHAAKAYAKFQRAAELSDDASRFDLQGSLAEAAFAAGDNAAARGHAAEILSRIEKMPRTWNTGNLLHDAHTTLGRVALAEDDVVTARAELLAAGKTPGSPQLDSFGPDFRLAAELLARGERDAVIQYLDLIAAFWDDGKAELAEWRAQLARGENPQLR